MTDLKSYPRPIAVTVSPLTQFVKSAVACVAPVNVHLKKKIVLIQLLQGWAQIERLIFLDHIPYQKQNL